MVDDIVIVVAGHDKYAAAWPAMLHGIRRYWPDCPWEIFWITNRLDAPKGCKTIKVGGDFNPKKWSNRMKRGLKQVPAKTILWCLDDHWPTQKPDVDALMDFAKLVGRGHIHRLRLYPGLDHDFGFLYRHDERLIIMDKKSPYRCSCKPSLWQRDALLNLLRNGESPWDFERDGRRRSRDYMFAVTKDWHWFFVTRDCPDGIEWPKSPLVKGKWTRAAEMYAKKEKIPIDLGNHPVKGNPFGKEKPKWVLPG